MKAAVVILNWNGKKLLETYLPSVLAHSVNAKVYVADNASTDDSLDFIAETFPEVVILKNESNLGYAGGYNEALKYVEEDIYVLLNNDVEVTHAWLEGLLSLFETSDRIAAVQPKIKSIQHPEKFDYAGAAGGFIDALGYPFCRGRIFDHLENDRGQYDTDMEIFWASGACFAVRKDCFREAKGFDESYFAHQEEIDLCWRLKNSGYSIWCSSKSEVFHQGGGTLSSSSPRKTFLNFRNSLSTLLKNSEKNPIPIIFLRMVMDGLAALRFLGKGKISHCFIILKAHVSFYSHIPEMLNKRRLLKKKKQKFMVKSIVWSSFVLKITRFDQLKFSNK
ncbi:glycosyltransferase family 2 protein [Psychroflexus sp. YR1-1]|uniref:Glycosyltransferase family 2 protein n=1 Tax=Psychroflexus aurantiacus TaxID=2709310 RepID=A0A6B3R1R3_9FLAO|nr:glycosyltransferase family 2 protein [Psychroflexus aurantiacus]NEV94202.1 glycosyltransferase family 2 protein [Psychroflexus aurantiacus]